ncbi:MAG: hypothetical protein ACNYPG_05250 [Candidatus Porifericomitaceae bacterium WSBS_2022_MAG_OTU9]
MKEFNFAKKLVFLAIFATLAGCEPRRGSIPASASGENVYIQYEQELFAHDGKLSVTMPDGEIFTGKFVQHVTTTSGSESSADWWDDDDNFVSTESTAVSSKAEAILVGNRGNSMECKMQFSKPKCGIDCGGIGKCKDSNGEQISIAF